MPETDALVELTDVSKHYDSPEGGAPARVLAGVNLRVAAGESVAVVGPSGSGKSTLLNIIGTLDRPTSGRVRLAGRDLLELTDRQLADLRGREIGFVFQLHHLLGQCTAEENVLVPTLLLDPAGRSEARSRARRLLERVGLADRLRYRPAQLSGGERQRVAVVRALVNRPKLLLADEPTGSLDARASAGLARLLTELNREEGVTLVVVTHSAALAAGMGRVYRLADGALADGEDDP